MLEEETENLSDIVNSTEYELLQKEIDIDSLDMMTSHGITGNNGLMDHGIDMMNADETTLSMEDLKYFQNYCTAFPPSEPSEICSTDYSGPYNFEVLVDPNIVKNPWEYSPILNKIYIDMKHKFPINFSVQNPDQRLFIRVMPMFEEDRYVQELVHRCICHEQSNDSTNKGIPDLVAQHIIRCDNNSAQYCGDKNANKRLSIVIPLSTPQAGTDSVKEYFQFVCKNSCPGGMNRRPIQVVFTLEDERGTVLGRRVLCVRICSCPKRDREKEEAKREKQQDCPPGKKRRVEKKVSQATDTSDTRLFALNLNIVGEDNYKHVLKYCQSLMADEIVKADSKNGNTAPYRKCRNEAANLLSQICDS